MEPLAHSAPEPGRLPQSYASHIAGARAIARRNAEAIAAYIRDPDQARRFVLAVVDAITFHDLGKLDFDNQSALRQGRKGRMKWDHVDAGVAHLLAEKAGTAAWIVRGHHPPGLPAFTRRGDPRLLRGGRIDRTEEAKADALIQRTNTQLAALVAEHIAAVGSHEITAGAVAHGLSLRLALSCLVDGDHSDSARYEHGRPTPIPPSPRWADRLARLDAYVAELPRGGERQADRDAFYQACRHGAVEPSMVTCQGPVGIGKTTAVTAWLLRRAIASCARRLFIVAPYTTILSQTAETLRKALVLPDEADQADEIVAEHHHRADFATIESRDLAVLWQAPIIVTTGVQFFETLAACEPSRLRKLHGLPGSVVFLDESHAALPAHLWRQNWAWLRKLTTDWGCSFVFASGSLARVWEYEDMVGESGVMKLPDLTDQTLNTHLVNAEYKRVRYRTLQRTTDIETAILNESGPRLAVFNTVQTAAVVATRLRQRQSDVLHLSTALCPDDRSAILEEVKRRLDRNSGYDADWTLVATSLVEAGVDLSFRCAFRERFSTASMIQIGGRVNRHGRAEQGWVFDFTLAADEMMKTHPGARRSAEVLERLFRRTSTFDGPIDASAVVTRAMLEEARDESGKLGCALKRAEHDRHYPEVARLARLIDTDTALAVVRAPLVEQLESGNGVPSRELLGGSVQIWRKRIDDLKLLPIRGRPDIFLWPYDYDSKFIGYMEGVLKFATGEAFII